MQPRHVIFHPGCQSVQGHVRDRGTREHCGHLRAFHAKKQPTLTKGFRVSECREHAPRPRCAAGSHTVCLPLYGRILMPDEHRSILCKGVSQRRTGRYERVTRGCHSPLTAPKCGRCSCVCNQVFAGNARGPRAISSGSLGENQRLERGFVTCCPPPTVCRSPDCDRAPVRKRARPPRIFGPFIWDDRVPDARTAGRLAAIQMRA